MKEIVYDFDEFKNKVSMGSPIHHSCVGRFADKQGILYNLTFRVYGVSRDGSHILIFETTRRLDTLSKGFNEKWTEGDFHSRLNIAIKDTLEELRKTYAVPIGSTEGRLEP